MKIFNQIKKILISFKQSIRRFPLTLTLSTLTSIILIAQLEISKSENANLHETLSRFAMILALSIPVSLIITFLFERYKKVKKSAKFLIYFVSLVFLIIYYLFCLEKFDMVSTTRFIALNLAFYLIALITPFFYNRENLELYTIKLVTRFFVTMLYSVVLQSGIGAILFTIDKLLGIHVYSNIYIYMWFLICGIFIPGYFLAGIPNEDEDILSIEYSKVLKILLLYIIMPLISIYTIILYIYFIKIVIAFQWPKGIVANLVLWYSAITSIVIFLIFPLKDENSWVKYFIFYITKIIIPLIIIMFLSIGIRIKAYGITENRYFVVALGIWVFIVMLYYNISKIKKNIFLPLTLSIIAILSVIGPWSSYSLSVLSQNKRFESILIKNKMLNNKTIKPSANISDEDKKDISSILSYFERYHSFKELKYIPDNFQISDMKSIFGFEYMDIWYNNEINDFFSYMLGDLSTPVDIKGYDYLFSFRYPKNINSQSNSRLKVEYSYDNQKIKIFLDNINVFEKDLSSIVKNIHNKYGYINKERIDLSDMTYIFETDRLNIKLIMFSINGMKDTASKDNIKINSIEFDLLVRIK
ncbi:DUF4153 domain-containing protein [Caloramator sp. E03]|uniref:DUF4153 domain-containing protein n=1 Tax=Caloramator sp. E03 TaxID=2576307 RepID=UPI0011107641|nr:DUF4153 domain-containing protein [Caloramator sp. E03]QCX34182.1 DUF4153 domain-containing protein [Caloramator sp. E03]